MTKTPQRHASSERGIALIVVLLLMVVLSGLATGFAMTGNVEATMARNETYYAGARAAAEAGINRATEAIRLEKDINILTGEDGLPNTADDGDVSFLLDDGVSPYPLGDDNGEYSYTVVVVDDDDPVMNNNEEFGPEQLIAMGEPDGVASVDQNTRVILRATGFGPSNTTATVARVVITDNNPIQGNPVNPAILVDGDVNVVGNLSLTGLHGSIHANGDMMIGGNAATVEGDATASGDLTITSNNFEAGGQQGGGYANINVPEVTASDYADIADYRLRADGSVLHVASNTVVCGVIPPCAGWSGWTTTTVGGVRQWEISGNTAPAGTMYIEGKVLISGSPKNGTDPIKTTLIATGSISVTGNPKFSPDNGNNPDAIQFVTDGDLRLQGTGDFEHTEIEGQIFVKEQIHTQGSWEFKGRIIVQDDANDWNEVAENSIGGTPNVDYDGTLPGYTPDPTDVYTYNVTGWIEQ